MKTLLFIEAAILLLAAALYFAERAFLKRRARLAEERAAAVRPIDPERYRMEQMDKLSEAFAEGEINREEFDRKRDEIMNANN